MELAIDQAFLGIPASPSNVTASCQTNNCTFESYLSMGVCSRVEDVTSTIVKNYSRHRHNSESSGCDYTVEELKANPPWRLGNLTTEAPIYTLWIGSSDNDFPESNTLTELYTIYFSNTTGFKDHNDVDRLNSVVALIGGWDLCVKRFATAVVNGTTVTSEESTLTNSKWNTVTKTIGTQSFNTTLCENDGVEYWMDVPARRAFHDFLGLEIFQGSSSSGINVVDLGSGSETSEIDAPLTIAGLLVNQPTGVGQDRLGNLLGNISTSMTNA